MQQSSPADGANAVKILTVHLTSHKTLTLKQAHHPLSTYQVNANTPSAIILQLYKDKCHANKLVGVPVFK